MIKKNGVSAPTAGVGIAAQPGVSFAVYNIYNETGTGTNGVVQAVTIDLPECIRLTGTYVSPTTSGRALPKFLSTVMGEGTWRDFMLGDFNARDFTWDTAGN